jgi:delta8-fatty-acid desaturase
MVRPIYTRDRVAAGILAGENLVILHNTVLKIPTTWLEKHPGGALSILHFVGRDATDEIEAYHSDLAMRLVKRYAVADIEIPEEGWKPFLPPIMSGWVRRMGKGGMPEWFNEAAAERSSQNTGDVPSSQVLLVARQDTPETGPTLDTITPPPCDLSLAEQTRISRNYRALHKKITEAGLYNTRYIAGYGPEFARYTLLGATAAYLYYKNWLMTSAAFLGLFWHQLVFICHDGGHMGVSGDWTWDRLLCISIADFIGGLSIGWWVDVCACFFFMDR